MRSSVLFLALIPPCFQVLRNKGVFWLASKSQNFLGAGGAENPIFERFSSFKTPKKFRPSAEKKMLQNKGGVLA